MPLPIQILANPIAGGGRSKDAAHRLAQALETRGLDTRLLMTERAGQAEDVASTLTADTCHTVVAVGGDGTVNEVVSGLRSPAPRLAVLPFGTGNVLAAELKLSTDPTVLADAIRSDQHLNVGVARVHDHRFLLFASFGPDARMATRLAEVRGGRGGKSKWIAPVLHVIRRWHRDQILVVDNKSGAEHGPYGQVLITRIRNYGGHFRMPGDIDLEDGLLHAVCFRQTTRWAFARATWRAWRGTLRLGKDVEVFDGTSFQVRHPEENQAVPCQVDGDPLRTAGPVATVAMETDLNLRLITPASSPPAPKP